MKSSTVYQDGRYALVWEEDVPCIVIAGHRYKLTCHPYEPCLYITNEAGNLTAVHNAFDPDCVLHAFRDGQTVTSITGMEYDALDFCRMVEQATGYVNIDIDVAERVFAGRAKKKHPLSEEKQERKETLDGGKTPRTGIDRIIGKDPFFELMEQYPDCVIDYCLVRNDPPERGYAAHWKALVWASRYLFLDEDEEVVWHFDVGKAEGVPIGPEELFAPVRKDGTMNYRKAFLHPPFGDVYADEDFDRINAALFPRGTEGLEVYQWSTGWSEYFDEGHEWWGTLCLTVYDSNLDRFVVILASATD